MYYVLWFLIGMCFMGAIVFAFAILVWRGVLLGKSPRLRELVAGYMQMRVEARMAAEQKKVRDFYRYGLFSDDDDNASLYERQWENLSARERHLVREGIADQIKNGSHFDPVTVFDRIDDLGLGDLLPKPDRDAIIERMVLGTFGDLTGTGILPSFMEYWKTDDIPGPVVERLVDGGCFFQLIQTKRVPVPTFKHHVIRALRSSIPFVADSIGAAKGTEYDTPENMEPIMRAAARMGNLEVLEKYYEESPVPEEYLRTCMETAQHSDEMTTARCCILLNDRTVAQACVQTMDDNEAVGMLAKFLRSTALAVT